MRLLLDTHAFLWFVWADLKLSATAKAAIEDPANQVYLSMASCWETAIKTGIAKLTLGASAAVFIPREMTLNGFALLDITLVHATAVETLPQHHKDPFDRLLIAQALIEGITVVSADAVFDAYGVTRLW